MELSPQATEAIDHLDELNGGVAALATLFDPELDLERGNRDHLSALLPMVVRTTALSTSKCVNCVRASGAISKLHWRRQDCAFARDDIGRDCAWIKNTIPRHVRVG